MTITLPLTESQHRPLHRILVSPQFYGGTWQQLPMAPNWILGQTNQGYEVQEWNNPTLPNIGQAEFLFRFGTINGRNYGVENSGGYISAQDLQGYFVRIQQCDGPTNSELGNGLLQVVLNWQTVWVGTVELQEDTIDPGGSYAIGLRRYHCLGILHYAARWPMLYHGFQGNVCRGHPGYNLMLSNGQIAGDQDIANTVYFQGDDNGSSSHTQRGQGSLWTDMDAVNDALLCGRINGDPLFQIEQDFGMLQGAQFWPVDESMNALGFIQEVLKRQRGRGTSYITWQSDVDAPLEDLELTLTVVPQLYEDINYVDPITQANVNIPGAATVGTSFAFVDLVGDHRVIDTTFRIGSRYVNAYGYVENVGEPIEVFVTLSYADQSLEQRWVGHPTSVSLDPEDEDIYQLHSTPIAWDLTAGNGLGAEIAPIDWQCDDDGSIVTGLYQTSPIISPHNIEVMKDTCVAAPGDELTGTLRGFPLAYINVAGSDLWIDVKSELGARFSLRPDGMLLEAAGDDKDATRDFSDPTLEELGAEFSYTALAFSVCISLPHRVRMADGDPNAARRKTIYHRNIRLWLVSGSAITGLDFTEGDGMAGHAPLRGDVGDLVGPNVYSVIDDRSKLALLHALSVAWYGTERSTASWQIKGSGFMAYFLDAAGVQHPYIELGQVLYQLGIAGGQATIMTPVTNIHFDVVRNVTTYFTDWSDLDLT